MYIYKFISFRYDGYKDMYDSECDYITHDINYSCTEFEELCLEAKEWCLENEYSVCRSTVLSILCNNFGFKIMKPNGEYEFDFDYDGERFNMGEDIDE